MKPIAEMTPQEKMALCMRHARRIVKNHRKKIPAGHEYKKTWVAAGVAVAGAVAGGVQAHNQAKDAEGAALEQQKRASKNRLPEFKPPALPSYVPFDFNKVNPDAIDADLAAYGRSDADYKRRHPGVVGAEGLFEQSVLNDQRGDTTLLPAIQSELFRAGVGGSLAAFGDTRPVLAPGSAGEANVARHLGLGVMDFQDRNRRNRERSLTIAEEIFPRREIGMSGQDLAMTSLSDTIAKNEFNAANYAAEAGAYEKNYAINAENMNAGTKEANDLAAAQAASEAAKAQALAGTVTSVAGALAQGYGKSTAGGPKGPNYTYQADGTYRPLKAKYPGTTAWVPVGKYANAA